MTDCVLPVTGSTPLFLVLLALLALGAGVALVLGVRRRGVGAGTAVVLTLALGAALVGLDARRADAQECPPATTVPPTAAPTTAAATTTAVTTSTTALATTTTAVTTTTVGGVVPTNPTFPTTTTIATTTTTVAAPDLMPSVEGPDVLLYPNEPQFTIRVTNIGMAPTDGATMTFTVNLPVIDAPEFGARIDASFFSPFDDWTVVEIPGEFGEEGAPGTPTRLEVTSVPGLVIAPNGSSTVSFNLRFNAEFGDGSFSVDPSLPTGIGGEPTAAGGNNAATHLVTVVDTRS